MKQQSSKAKKASGATKARKGAAAKRTRAAKPAAARRRAASAGKSRPATKKTAQAAKSTPAKKRPAAAPTGRASTSGKAAKSTSRPRPSRAKAAGKKARKTKARALLKPTTDAAFRLPRDVKPIRYHVHILPDLVRANFRGEVMIELELKHQRPSIELHAADITIDHAEIAPRDGKPQKPPKPMVPGAKPVGPPINQVAVAIVPHGARETVEVKFLRPVGPGKYALSLAYHGNLQERLRGLYMARVGDQRYAFTQLEAADARRFFPCFDEPDLKARFTFSVTARAGLTVISNNPLERSVNNTNGTTTFHFKTTPPLSTYLCALAVGELEGSQVRYAGKVPIRVWHVPGKRHLTGFALEAAVETLTRLEKYFGLPYPYEKLDLVAVPDFEAGAMENAGAVFFRETLLLVDPATISLAEKKRVAEVIAHELAHMWFGNLVTMKWWDDLWLNEAFATWMAFKIVDEWKPEWRMWNNFEPHRAAALALDALANTHPIYAEVENAAQATENFDAITYEKGASVVRMVEHYLGPQKFRAGVQAYIRDHREGNAVAADLWNALEKASGQPVAQIVRAWVRQAGFPLVSFERDEEAKPASLVVKQERFKASPTTKFPEGGASAWPLPMVVKFAGTGGRGPRVERFLIKRAKERIPVPGGKHVPWFYGNVGEGGFYRVLHDPETLSALANELATALTPVERMGLVGHQWAIVRSGRARIASFLDLVGAMGNETDYEVLDSLAAPLSFIEDQVVEGAGADTRKPFIDWIAEVFRPAWQELGWDAAPTDDDERKLRRGSLLRLVGLLGEDPEVASEAVPRFLRYLQDRSSVEPNLVDPLIAIVARDGDEERFERMRRAVAEARTPQESRRFQLALGDFRDPELARRAAELTLTPEIPTQDVGFLLIRLLGNRAAREITWRFIKENWAVLVKRLPPMMVSRVIEATASLQTREHRKEVAMFFRAHPVETATRALKLALERFDINEELRRRAGRDLRAWLVARGVVFEPSPEPAPGASPEPAQAPGTDAPVVG
ncbi:MAG TPA: M1 family metallopeptidase [Candidatus Binatia bacterium]